MKPTIDELYAMPLSQLLRTAVADARAAEQAPGYELNMGFWYAYDAARDVCIVCMAGSMLIGRIPRECSAVPFDYDVMGRVLRAVEHMRVGHFGLAAYALSRVDVRIDTCDAARGIISVNWDGDLERAPWHIYEQAAKMLERAGL